MDSEAALYKTDTAEILNSVTADIVERVTFAIFEYRSAFLSVCQREREREFMFFGAYDRYNIVCEFWVKKSLNIGWLMYVVMCQVSLLFSSKLIFLCNVFIHI